MFLVKSSSDPRNGDNWLKNNIKSMVVLFGDFFWGDGGAVF